MKSEADYKFRGYPKRECSIQRRSEVLKFTKGVFSVCRMIRVDRSLEKNEKRTKRRGGNWRQNGRR